jgi:hypothetical protein
MRFLTIFTGPEQDAPPSEAEMATMGKFIEEGARAGWLVMTEGCQPSALGARVRLSGGEVTVTDGPFSEAKEVVGGFAIIRASSKDEAIALSRHFLGVAGDGECEVRQLYDEPAYDSARANGATTATA